MGQIQEERFSGMVADELDGPLGQSVGEVGLAFELELGSGAKTEVSARRDKKLSIECHRARIWRSG